MPERHVATAHVLISRPAIERITPQHERRHQGGGRKRGHVEFVLGIGCRPGNGLDAVGKIEAVDDHRFVHGPEMRGPRCFLTLGSDRQQLDPFDGSRTHYVLTFRLMIIYQYAVVKRYFPVVSAARKRSAKPKVTCCGCAVRGSSTVRYSPQIVPDMPETAVPLQ